jgi:hypothetical protein
VLELLFRCVLDDVSHLMLGEARLLVSRLRERRRERVRGNVPIGRAHAHRLHQDRLYGSGKQIELLAMSRQRIDESLVLHRVVGYPHAWCLSHHHLVEHAGEAVHVCRLVEIGPPGSLLGAHVAERTDGEPGARQLGAPGGADRLGDAEVGDYRMPFGQEDVLGLDVSVDEPLAVRVAQRAGHLSRDRQRGCESDGLLAVEQATD